MMINTREFLQPVWRRLNVWLLIIPIIYFATDGHLLTKSGNVATNLSSTGRGWVVWVEQFITWTLVIVSSWDHFPRVLKALLRYKSFTLLLGWICLSVLWSSSPGDTVRRVTMFALTLLFSYLLAERFSREEQMAISVMACTVVTLLSLFAVFALPSIGHGPNGEWKGVFGHKNALGVNLMFLSLSSFFVKARTSVDKIVLVGIILLAGLLEVKSETRTGWLLVIIALAYILYIKYISRFRRLDTVAVLLTSGAGIVAIALWGLFHVENIALLLGKSSDLTGRIPIWAVVLRAIYKHPVLGYGYGGFWNELHGESFSAIAELGWAVPSAHNGYLDICLQLGVVGLLLFLWSMLSAALNLVKCLAVGDRSNYVLWCGAIILLVAVGSIDETFILYPNSFDTVLYVMACIGLQKASKLRGESK